MQDRGISILVVEDEFIVAADISASLRKVGYRVLATVPTGAEAFDAVRRSQPDLILMDIKLKGELDGIQTAERIQQEFRIPVIYLSAFTDEDTLSRAKLTEPFGYITKPFNQREVYSAIEMALYKHRMESVVRDKEELLETTLGSIEDGVITTDAYGTVRFLNRSALRLLGIGPGIADGLPVERVLRISRDEEGSEPFRLIAPTEQAGTDPASGRAFLLRDESGPPVPIEYRRSLLLDRLNRVTGHVLVIRDITVQLDREAMQSRLASVVEYSRDAIVSCSPEGIIRSWNRGAQEMFGYTESEVSGLNIALLTPAYVPDEIPQLLQELVEGKPARRIETYRKAKDGRVLSVAITLSPIQGQAGELRGVSIIATDITERRKLEKEVLEISAGERQRIGQELHDSLGQLLTGISLKIGALENMLGREKLPREKALARELSELVQGAIGQTRNLARGLIPLTLRSEGLAGALKELAEDADSLFGMRITVSAPEDLPLPEVALVSQLYGVAREAVNNAHRHGHATAMSITLSMEYSELCLSLHDNGTGIRKDRTPGLGLRIMEHRANSVGGRLEVFRAEEGGTFVVCRIPIPALIESDGAPIIAAEAPTSSGGYEE